MNEIIKEVSIKLQTNKQKISFVESCTGGALVSALVSIPGASNILDASFVTYSEEAKKEIVNVKQETLDKYTVYSKEVAYEMCEGLYQKTKCDICVSITGHAGGSDDKENGIAYLCIRHLGHYLEYKLVEKGTREEVRCKFVKDVFTILNKLI